MGTSLSDASHAGEWLSSCERLRVLVDVAFIGGDDLAERRSRRVDVDLQDRVGGLVLLGLAVRVAGAPVGVLRRRVIGRRAPQAAARVAFFLRAGGIVGVVFTTAPVFALISAKPPVAVGSPSGAE